MNPIKSPHQILLEKAGLSLDPSPGLVNTPQQMLLQQANALPQYAPGGKVGALAKFLEGNHPLVPNVVYHATRATPKGQAIDQMISSKSGTLGSGMYTTPNTDFASMYTGIPTPKTIEGLKTSFPAMARPYVKAMEEGDFSDIPMGGYMMPLHPSVKNPLILQGVHADPAYEALAKLGVPDNKIDSIVEKANEKYGSIGKEIQSRAQKAGHDGVILFKDGDIQEMVTYSPNQLKSATGNEGTFNPYDPRLSKANGGSIHQNLSPADMQAAMIVDGQTPQRFATGSLVKNIGTQTAMNVPFMAEDAMEIAKDIKNKKYKEAAAKTVGVGYSAFTPFNPLTALISGLTYSPETGDATLDAYKKEQEDKAAMAQARARALSPVFKRDKPPTLNEMQQEVFGYPNIQLPQIK